MTLRTSAAAFSRRLPLLRRLDRRLRRLAEPLAGRVGATAWPSPARMAAFGRRASWPAGLVGLRRSFALRGVELRHRLWAPIRGEHAQPPSPPQRATGPEALRPASSRPRLVPATLHKPSAPLELPAEVDRPRGTAAEQHVLWRWRPLVRLVRFTAGGAPPARPGTAGARLGMQRPAADPVQVVAPVPSPPFEAPAIAWPRGRPAVLPRPRTLVRVVTHRTRPPAPPVPRAAARTAAPGRRPLPAPPAAAPLALGPSAGSPLPLRLRRVMRARLGFDPGAARVHTGPSAAQAAQALNAAAFTVGRHVFFGRGRFAPETPAGAELIAHELTHVRQAPAGRPFAPGELPPERHAALEAEARAAGVVGRAPATPRPRLVLAPPALGAPSPAVPLLAPADPVAVATPTPVDREPQAQPAPPAPPAPDVRALADEVYRLLDRRMHIERERTGVQRWH